jgi:hypothetical protein
MKLAIENATRASKTAAPTEMASTKLLLALGTAAWEAQEDAAVDAEGIPEQAKKADALDPVG